MTTWQDIYEQLVNGIPPEEDTALIRREKGNMAAADTCISEFLAGRQPPSEAPIGVNWDWEASFIHGPGRRRSTYSLGINRDGTWNLTESVRNDKVMYLFCLCIRNLQNGNYQEQYLGQLDPMLDRLTDNEWYAFRLALGTLMRKCDIPFPTHEPAVEINTTM